MILKYKIIGISLILVFIWGLYQYYTITLGNLRLELESQKILSEQKIKEVEILTEKIKEFEKIDNSSRQIVKDIKPNETLSPTISDYVNRLRLYQNGITGN